MLGFTPLHSELSHVRCVEPSDEIIESLVGCQRLVDLSCVVHPTSSNRPFSILSSLPNLKELAVRSTDSSLAVFDTPKPFNALQTFQFHLTTAIVPDLSPLCKIPSLTFLRLASHVNATSIATLGKLTKLHERELFVKTDQGRPGSMFQPLSHLTNLIGLQFNVYPEVTSPSELSFLPKLTALRKLIVGSRVPTCELLSPLSNLQILRSDIGLLPFQTDVSALTTLTKLQSVCFFYPSFHGEALVNAQQSLHKQQADELRTVLKNLHVSMKHGDRTVALE